MKNGFKREGKEILPEKDTMVELKSLTNDKEKVAAEDYRELGFLILDHVKVLLKTTDDNIEESNQVLNNISKSVIDLILKSSPTVLNSASSNENDFLEGLVAGLTGISSTKYLSGTNQTLSKNQTEFDSTDSIYEDLSLSLDNSSTSTVIDSGTAPIKESMDSITAPAKKLNKSLNKSKSVIDSITAPINELNKLIEPMDSITAPMDSITAPIKELNKSLNKSKSVIDSITAPMDSITAPIKELNKSWTNEEFDSEMNELAEEDQGTLFDGAKTSDDIEEAHHISNKDVVRKANQAVSKKLSSWGLPSVAKVANNFFEALEKDLDMSSKKD